MKVKEPSVMGPLIVALRLRLGMAQRPFAKACGIEREHLSNIENGRNKLSGVAIRQSLATGAGMSLDAMNAYLDRGVSLESLGVPGLAAAGVAA